MLHIWHHWLHLSAALVMYQLFFVFFILFCGKLQTPSWPGVRLWIDVATEKNMSGEKKKAVMLKLKLNQQIQRHVDTYLHRYVCLYLYIYLNATNGSSALMCHTLHSWAFFSFSHTCLKYVCLEFAVIFKILSSLIVKLIIQFWYPASMFTEVCDYFILMTWISLLQFKACIPQSVEMIRIFPLHICKAITTDHFYTWKETFI